MLVHQHPEGDAVGVEAVQEVLYIVADEGIEAVRFLILDHPLGHRGHHVIVPATYPVQGVQETEGNNSE